MYGTANIFSDDGVSLEIIEIGAPNVDVQLLLMSATNVDYLDRGSVQVCVLSDVQRCLQRRVHDDCCDPGSLEIIMLCILGFPSLMVEAVVDVQKNVCKSQGLPSDARCFYMVNPFRNVRRLLKNGSNNIRLNGS